MNKKLKTKAFNEFSHAAFENLKSFAFNLTVQDVADLHKTESKYVIAQILKALNEKSYILSDEMTASLALDNIAKAQNFYSLDESARTELVSSIANESVTLTEDSMQQNVRAAVATLEKLPEEENKKALQMLGMLTNDVYEANNCQKAIDLIQGIEQPQVKEYMSNKLNVAVRTRLLQMTNLLMGRNNYGPLEALAEISNTRSIIEKLADIATDDFMKDISLEESKARPRQTGNLVVDLQGEIDNAFEVEGYTFITDPYASRTFNRARFMIEDPHRGLGLVSRFNDGIYEYDNLTPEQKEDVLAVIADVVSDTIEQIKGISRKAPRRSYTKSRSGFPGTATKTQKGHF